MTQQQIVLRPHRRYRLKGERARALIAMFEPLARNDAFARFIGAGKSPTITVRTRERVLDLNVTWSYCFAGGTADLRVEFLDLPLP